MTDSAAWVSAPIVASCVASSCALRPASASDAVGARWEETTAWAAMASSATRYSWSWAERAGEAASAAVPPADRGRWLPSGHSSSGRGPPISCASAWTPISRVEMLKLARASKPLLYCSWRLFAALSRAARAT